MLWALLGSGRWLKKFLGTSDGSTRRNYSGGSRGVFSDSRLILCLLLDKLYCAYSLSFSWCLKLTFWHFLASADATALSAVSGWDQILWVMTGKVKSLGTQRWSVLPLPWDQASKTLADSDRYPFYLFLYTCKDKPFTLAVGNLV